MARWEDARLLSDCWHPEAGLGLRAVRPRPGEDNKEDEPRTPKFGINNCFVATC